MIQVYVLGTKLENRFIMGDNLEKWFTADVEFLAYGLLTSWLVTSINQYKQRVYIFMDLQ